VELLTKRTKDPESYDKEILSKPFDFTKKASVELDSDKLTYAVNQQELTEHWNKFLKYQVLTRVHEMQETQTKAAEKKDTVVVIKKFDALEAEAREKVLKSQNDIFHRLSQLDKTDRLSFYINSIVSTYDPHSNYFPPKDKENFDI